MSSATIDTFMSPTPPLSGTDITVTLMWTTTGAVTVRLEVEPNAGPGRMTHHSLPLNSMAGGYMVPGTVNSTTTFTLVVTGEDGLETRQQVIVEVTDEQAVIGMFTAEPSGEVAPNTNVTLNWDTTDATDWTLMANTGVNVQDPGALIGMETVTPAVTTIYTLTATGKNTIPVSQSEMVMVTGTQAAPVVGSFTATPTGSVTEETELMLEWSGVTNATGIGIMADPGGAVAIPAGQPIAGGMVTVTPPVGMTTYTFTATGPGGTVTEEEMVTVTEADAAAIISFTAAPDPAPYGADVTLGWEVSNAADPGGISITASPADPGGDIEIPMGATSVMVNPITTTTYTLRAISAGSNPRPVTRRLLVNVNAALTPAIGSFTTSAIDDTIDDGEMTTLTWSGVTGADSVSIMAVPGGAITIPDLAMMVASGSVEVMPSVTTVYTLTATGPGGMSTMEATVTVTPSPSAVITSFTAGTSSNYGAEVALTWVTTGAASVSITASSGETVTIPEDQQAASGSVTVTPIVPTTYTLTARAAGSNPRPVSSQVHVVVNEPRQPEIPEDGFTGLDSPEPNTAVTLTWMGVTNAAKVILSSNGVTIAEFDESNMPDTGTYTSGTYDVQPTVSTIYTLTAVGIDRATDRVSKTVTVTVTPTPVGFQRTVE